MRILVKKGFQLALVAAVAVIAAPQNAWAVGETTGRIGGTVTEAQTGAPVPGATVTVTGGSLIGGPKTITTGDDGHYDVVELPPGTYNVEVSYSGVKPIKRRVVVRQGELLPLDIAWSAELAEAEVTVVVEERHMTKPDTTMTGTVLSNDTEAKIASLRQYQDIATQVAGVMDSVGAPGNPIVKGADYQSNRFLVDGLDITDPITSTFSANINFDSISSVEVITGGMEAQYNAMGGVINLITNGGSDEWHVDASLYINNDHFATQEQFGSNPWDGTVPRNRINVPPQQRYQANVNVGGPILKHRLWFNVSIEYDYSQSTTPAGPPLNLQSPNRLFQSVYARGKIVWAPNEKHRISLSVSTDPTTIRNIDTGSAANRRLSTAQDYQKQGGAFGILQWDYFLNNNINTQVQAGFTYEDIEEGSMGYFASPDLTGAEKMFSASAQNYDFNRPGHFNLQGLTTWYQGDDPSVDHRYTLQIDPSISMRGKAAGSHDAKIGIQTRLMRSDYSLTRSGGGISYEDNGGGTGEAGLCDETTGKGCYLKFVNSSYHQQYSGVSVGAYIQDRWKPFKRLTILPGIRFDWGATQNAQGVTASNLFGIGPRIGAVVDITGDQKTIFSAFYGRANDVQNMVPAFFTSFTPLSQTFFWDQSSKAFDILASQSGGNKGVVVDTSATTPPHTDEVTGSFRREVFQKLGGLDRVHLQAHRQHVGSRRDQPDLGSDRLSRCRFRRQQQPAGDLQGHDQPQPDPRVSRRRLLGRSAPVGALGPLRGLYALVAVR
jgi:hypothetical protein